MKYDVVYIVRQWVNNNMELLFSLRSLANIEHWDIYIIWHLPKWAKNVIHIPCRDNFKYKTQNVLNKIKIACWLCDDFILMNDDFYITKPTQIKYYHKWTIEEHLETRQTHLKQKPLTKIIERDFELDDLDFELHCPFLVNSKKALKLFEKYDMKMHLFRSLYWKEYVKKSELVKDYKINNFKDLELVKKENPTFISSRDDFMNRPFIKYLQSLFPKKSEYEKDVKFRF